MPVRLFVAPAASGKSAWVVSKVVGLARNLGASPIVCVPRQLQVRALRRRLAEADGVAGVRLLTFDRLYMACLDEAGETYVQIAGPVASRLLRSVLGQVELEHYAALAGRAGFAAEVHRLIGELKAGRVRPDAFRAATQAMGAEARLVELALIYEAYQSVLADHGWADRAGLGWLAVEALEERAVDVGRDWPLLVLDGFDDFTRLQIDLLRILAARVGEMVITLTGDPVGTGTRRVLGRFDRTRTLLEAALHIQAEPLPAMTDHHVPPLRRLEQRMYCDVRPTPGPDCAVDLIAAPDRPAEAREALRWLKMRIVMDGMAPRDVALLARDLSRYRPFVVATAREFALPVQVVDGLPLAESPPVAALLDLLKLSLPDGAGEPAVPRRLVIEALRSPYFDWTLVTQAVSGDSAAADSEGDSAGADSAGDSSAADSEGDSAAADSEGDSAGADSAGDSAAADGEGDSAGTDGAGESAGADSEGDSSAADSDGDPTGARFAESLDAVARWGRVIAGCSQWREAIAALSGRRADTALDDEMELPRGLPVGDGARAVGARFDAMLACVTPPPEASTMRAFVAWIERLIGPDPNLAPDGHGPASPRHPGSLAVMACARRASTDGIAIVERDVAALRALKDVLRALVWSEELLAPAGTVTYARFVDEVIGGVEAATYPLQVSAERDGILVADVAQGRGLPFRAVAVVGLAEGEFPATLREDALLRDADRRCLSDVHGFDVELSTVSAELEFFYECASRGRERLLLTRPRLADNGAPWKASPFWDEVAGWSGATEIALQSDDRPPANVACSVTELLETAAAADDMAECVAARAPESWARIERASRVLLSRSRAVAHSVYDGDLSAHRPMFAARFAADRPWSASAIETYRGCPFQFFIGRVLGLEPRSVPAEGLDARQLGTIYHHILECLYRHAADPTDVASLLANIESVADPILDRAPETEGFRETAWWQRTRDEIVGHIRASVAALGEISGDFVPREFEQRFWEATALEVVDGDDRFRLRGIIDRLDVATDGRVRVIDYKTAGPSEYTMKALVDGKRIQIALYALAARDALGLGEPAEGLYWHVQHAKPSALRLSKFDGGPAAAMGHAVSMAWEAVRGARAGRFVPTPPAVGCPDFCPAAGFCWRYRARRM